jgi:hypothetical protein
LWFILPDFDVLVARNRGAAILRLAISRADLDRIRICDLVVLVLDRQFGAAPKSDPGNAKGARRAPEIFHFHVQLFDFAIPDPPGLWLHSRNAT